MPKCSHCGKAQSRLNKGGLCKGCNSSDNISSKTLNSTMETKETNFDNVFNDREKLWYDEMHTILKEQIEFLKSEITIKNSLIESLMFELYNRNPEGTTNESVSVVTTNSNDVLSESLKVSSDNMIKNNYIHENENYDNQTIFAHNGKTYSSAPSRDIIHPNRVLNNEIDSNHETEFLTEEIIIN